MLWKWQPELVIQLLKSLIGLHSTLAKAEAPTVLWNLCDETLHLAFLNLNSPFSCTDQVPIILASLFFPHHAKCTRDEDGNVCIDHWGFICLDPGCLWTSFTLLFWGGGLQLNIIYIYYSDTPQALFLYVFFLPFSCSINDQNDCATQVIYHWVSSSTIFCIFFPRVFLSLKECMQSLPRL